MSDEKIKIGISQGDINGVGLEVILKTLMEPSLIEICTPVLFSSQKTVSYYRKVLGLEELNFQVIRDFNQFNNKKVNLFSCYEEEVNIEIKNIQYYGSQPWPFPDSLMLAFTADYASGDIQIDHKEIEDANWYDIDHLPGRPSSSLSIAQELIDSQLR